MKEIKIAYSWVPSDALVGMPNSLVPPNTLEPSLFK